MRLLLRRRTDSQPEGFTVDLGLGRALASQLYAVGWLDPLALGASALAFTAVALLACWLPARRATKVDPIVALRAE
jgi:putative ABC transport system permease protein